MEITGADIRKTRKYKDIRQADLAKQLGVSATTLWMIENGQKDSRLNPNDKQYGHIYTKIVDIFPDIFGTESSKYKLTELRKELREFLIDYDINGLKGSFQDYMNRFREEVGLNGEAV